MQDLEKLFFAFTPNLHRGLEKQLPELSVPLDNQLDNVAARGVFECSLQSP